MGEQVNKMYKCRNTYVKSGNTKFRWKIKMSKYEEEHNNLDISITKREANESVK